MLILRPEELMALHDATVARFGGLTADLNSHSSAQKAQGVCGRIRMAMYYRGACYNWDDPYISAALHAGFIAKAHAFADGNKRTALHAAGLILLRAGIAICDNEKLPELFVQLAEKEMDVERLASVLEELVTKKSAVDADSGALFGIRALSRRAIDPVNIQKAKEFVLEKGDKSTFYVWGTGIERNEDNGWLLWNTVCNTILRQHQTWRAQNPRDLLSCLRWHDEDQEGKLCEICSMIREADLLEICCLREIFHLSDQFLVPVLEALDERCLLGRTTVIYDSRHPDEYFSKRNREPTKFFKTMVLCKPLL